MLGLDPRLAEHARLILGQQDRIVRLVSKDADHRTQSSHPTPQCRPSACQKSGVEVENRVIATNVLPENGHTETAGLRRADLVDGD